MPLFKCFCCGCLENTACTPESWGNPRDKMRCSECSTGKWHGKFPKQTPEEAGYELNLEESNWQYYEKK